MSEIANKRRNCIVIPCYNEENRLNINEFKNFLTKNPDYVLIFVNDGSKDNTFRLLKEIQLHSPENVYIVDHKKNSGKSHAVRSGILKAIEINSFEVIGFLDADLATSFDTALILITKLSHQASHHAIIGSRVNLLGSSITRSRIRILLSRVLSTITNFIFHIKAHDSQCGAKFFKYQFARQIFSSNFSTKWLFDIEILLRAKKLSENSIFEEPIRQWHHMSDSKVKVGDYFKIIREIILLIKAY